MSVFYEYNLIFMTFITQIFTFTPLTSSLYPLFHPDILLNLLHSFIIYTYICN